MHVQTTYILYKKISPVRNNLTKKEKQPMRNNFDHKRVLGRFGEREVWEFQAFVNGTDHCKSDS
jgi:hypothetical protein